MKKQLLTSRTTSAIDAAVLILRLMLGIWLFAHGAQKLFGIFGGKGIDAALTGQAGVGIPNWLTYLSVYTECFGGLMITFGFLTRIASAFMLINMLVAASMHLSKGFFAVEDPLSFAMMALAILLIGPGVWSIDYLIFEKRASGTTVLL